jgi:hypothetical protein
MKKKETASAVRDLCSVLRNTSCTMIAARAADAKSQAGVKDAVADA